MRNLRIEEVKIPFSNHIISKTFKLGLEKVFDTKAHATPVAVNQGSLPLRRHLTIFYCHNCRCCYWLIVDAAKHQRTHRTTPYNERIFQPTS